MRIVKSVFPVLLLTSFFSAVSYGVVAGRIRGEIDPSQTVKVKGNVHGFAQRETDLGRADASKMMQGVTLVFHPSAVQQKDLDNLLAQQQDRSSPNYRKWLTPAQFADRFGMLRADIKRVVGWLQSQGFAVTSVANSRNEISFDGTVSQIETTFGTEIHNYAADGVVHFANATDPSVPAALAESVLAVGHLHDFAPKPRMKARPHLTSYVSGNHFLSPGDFATIYDVTPLYNSSIDGTGQKIAIVGQSSVNLADLSSFRSAAGLAAKAPQTVPLPGTTSTRCPGDEGESDLDLEWSGGVAKNASIIFVTAGLKTGDSCAGTRTVSVWDALNYAVQNNVAPVVSTSYGFCESGLGTTFTSQLRSWAQQANTQGQTIVSASGDSGAADCDGAVTSAAKGLAVDAPASIPEVTGMGGNTFTGDGPGTVTGTTAGPTQFWAGTSAGADDVSSALSYIPEDAWNDTAFDIMHGSGLAASGGGASIFFAKPTWQTGIGVPNDGKRDVPDLAIGASPNHDGYLVCSEDGANGAITPSCTTGFRSGPAPGSFTVVGGTSVAAPTFAAILTLINQQLGTSGLGNVNPDLYQFAASTSSPFHDVITGDNKVPCTSGTPNCPAGTTQFGFTAGPGYDQVTGLGSVDAGKLASSIAATLASFTLSASAPNPTSVTAGNSTASTLTITPQNGFNGTVTFACSNLPTGATCSFNPTTVTGSGTTQLTIQTAANTLAATSSVTVMGSSGAVSGQTIVSLMVTAPFSLAPTTPSFQVAQGATVNATINVAFATGFTGTITFTCSDNVSESSCTAPPQVNKPGPVSFTIMTTPPTVGMDRHSGGSAGIFYAALLPGFLGIVVMASSRRSQRGMRLLGLIVVVGFSALWLGSCGGSGSSNKANAGTPKGTYNITVSGTSGATSSTSFQLVVQ